MLEREIIRERTREKTKEKLRQRVRGSSVRTENENVRVIELPVRVNSKQRKRAPGTRFIFSPFQLYVRTQLPIRLFGGVRNTQRRKGKKILILRTQIGGELRREERRGLS